MEGTDPNKTNWKTRLSSFSAGISKKIRDKWEQGNWSQKFSRAGETLKSRVLNPVGDRLENLQLRNKLVKILPQDLAKTLPRNFDLLALADWFSQAFQRQGASFYGRMVAILLSAYFLADGSAYLIGKYIPDPPVSRSSKSTLSQKKTKSIEDYNVIVSRNLFNSQKIIPGEEGPITPGIQPDLGGAPVKSSLPFNLIGTLILKNELRSIATIEDKAANLVYPVRIQDEIPSKARITRIESTRVTFINISSGQKEYIEIVETFTANPRVTVGKKTSGPSGVERVSPTQFNVSRVEVDRTLSDLNNVLTQARCVPNIENGSSAGYRCFQIVPGSIYDKLGLHNNDVVMAINGQSMSDPSKAFEQLSGLKDSNHVELTVKRDGRVMNLAYDIR